MSGRRSLVGGLGATLCLAFLLGVMGASARADFTESFCGGAPAAPWVEGSPDGSPWAAVDDSCASASGSYGFDNETADLPVGALGGDGERPAG